MGLIRYLDTVLSLPLEAEFLVFPDDSCVGGVTGKLSCAVAISDTVGVVTVKSLLCVTEMLSDFCIYNRQGRLRSDRRKYFIQTKITVRRKCFRVIQLKPIDIITVNKQVISFHKTSLIKFQLILIAEFSCLLSANIPLSPCSSLALPSLSLHTHCHYSHHPHHIHSLYLHPH